MRHYPKYVQVVTDKVGVARHYVRVNGERVRINAEPFTPEYYSCYARAVEQLKGVVTAQPRPDNTRLDACVQAYMVSDAVTHNTAQNRRAKRVALSKIVNGYEAEHPSRLNWPYIKAVRDAKCTTASMKNEFVIFVTAFMNWLVDEGIITHHDIPRGRKALIARPKSSHATWREEHFTMFRNYWPIGTKQRLMMCLLENTAQRCETVRMLGSANVVSGDIVIDNTPKGGDDIQIPLSPETQEAIVSYHSGGKFYFPHRDKPDHPQRAADFSRSFSVACRQAGLPEGYTAHGIRHGVPTLLAERGYSAEIIRSLTGHKTLRMVEHYTQKARKALMARAAYSGLYEGATAYGGKPQAPVANTGP